MIISFLQWWSIWYHHEEETGVLLRALALSPRRWLIWYHHEPTKTSSLPSWGVLLRALLLPMRQLRLLPRALLLRALLLRALLLPSGKGGVLARLRALLLLHWAWMRCSEHSSSICGAHASTHTEG